MDRIGQTGQIGWLPAGVRGLSAAAVSLRHAQLDEEGVALVKASWCVLRSFDVLVELEGVRLEELEAPRLRVGVPATLPLEEPLCVAALLVILQHPLRRRNKPTKMAASSRLVPSETHAQVSSDQCPSVLGRTSGMCRPKLSRPTPALEAKASTSSTPPFVLDPPASFDALAACGSGWHSLQERGHKRRIPLGSFQHSPAAARSRQPLKRVHPTLRAVT